MCRIKHKNFFENQWIFHFHLLLSGETCGSMMMLICRKTRLERNLFDKGSIRMHKGFVCCVITWMLAFGAAKAEWISPTTGLPSLRSQRRQCWLSSVMQARRQR